MSLYNRFLLLLAYAQAGKAPRGIRLQLAQAAYFFCFMTALVLVMLIEIGLAWCFGDWSYISGHGTFLTVMNGCIALAILAIIIWPPAQFRARWTEAQTLVTSLNSPSRIADAPELRWLAPSTEHLSRRGKPLGYLPNLHLVPSATAWWRPIGYILLLAYIFGYLQLVVSLEYFIRAQAQSVAQFNALQGTVTSSQSMLNLFIGAACIGLLLYLGERRRLWADAEGLHWRRGRQWERLPWREIRALGVYRAYPQQRAPLLYLIASERHLIMWTYPRYDAPFNRNVTERALALAMAQTGLPIRDLTQLGQWNPETALPKPHAGQAVAVHRLTQPAPAQHSVQQQHGLISTVLALGLIFTALIVTPSASDALVEQALWPAYLATLPQHIEQQHPIFTDALRAPDGLWPTQKANQGNPTTDAYSATGYTISGNGAAYAPALLSTTYYAVAIQVTVHNIGLPGYRGGLPFPVVGAGIVMRADTESGGYIHYCAFEINGAGRWGDSGAFQSGAGTGFSPYIQIGPGNVNTLFVIARGLMHSMYVNGHYLGTFTDEYSCPPVGQIGLVNDSGDAAVSFTDFKVWSVTAPPAFSYV